MQRSNVMHLPRPALRIKFSRLAPAFPPAFRLWQLCHPQVFFVRLHNERPIICPPVQPPAPTSQPTRAPPRTHSPARPPIHPSNPRSSSARQPISVQPTVARHPPTNPLVNVLFLPLSDPPTCQSTHLPTQTQKTANRSCSESFAQRPGPQCRQTCRQVLQAVHLGYRRPAGRGADKRRLDRDARAAA